MSRLAAVATGMRVAGAQPGDLRFHDGNNVSSGIRAVSTDVMDVDSRGEVYSAVEGGAGRGVIFDRLLRSR
ncbi:hypothetical protein Ait01nite_058940 [Actinoplanes italicus]|nr:hypothetical protein Ait01nite_058940 [Actinoplanes italicus]